MRELVDGYHGGRDSWYGRYVGSVGCPRRASGDSFVNSGMHETVAGETIIAGRIMYNGTVSVVDVVCT